MFGMVSFRRMFFIERAFLGGSGGGVKVNDKRYCVLSFLFVD